MDETQEFLEQLGLPDLEGQNVVVEMVVQRTSQADSETQEETQKEKITLQLDSSSAPVTAANFVDLVEKDFYDSLAFHRFVEGFVIQGGDPQGRDPDFPIDDLGSGGYIDPETGEEREIPLEIQVAETGEIFYNEIVDAPVTLSNTAGVIAMARTQVLDTASSQFYIPVEDVSEQLDGGYAVFGEVTDGFDVVQELREGDRIVIARVVEGEIPTRVSDIVLDFDLLNEYANQDGANKINFLVPTDTNSDDFGFTPTNDNDSDIQGPILAASQVNENDPTDGDDRLTMSQVDDSSLTMMGLEGNDEIQGTDGNNILSGNQDNDSLLGLQGDDWLRGGKGNDTLIGGRGDDYLIGDRGVDVLTGGEGVDSFILQVNIVELDEINEIDQATRITDFSFTDGDEILVVADADFIPDEDLSYQSIDGDTVIRTLGSGLILGVVENSVIEDVESSIFVVSSDDYALRFG
ncbi:peptidylprolyl isomerase [Okeania sp.]|uniref:peptidylprolyl isomerase n=1 Tax=Okeania sp. TaxID=3100323 RepID=UPI002B4B8EB2|nr:peptidylprolyl isomerase [Okeania sp.]MEB3340461.1 peptidylprolyl isomerase [Okeania sp.]